MSGFFGADTDQLREHASMLQGKAQRLMELRDSLEPLVMDESIWQGQDADSFRQSWSGVTEPLFAGSGEDLTRRGRDLEEHAEQQDTASGADGGSGAGDGSGGGSDEAFNPLSFLGEFASKAQGIFKNSTKMLDFLKRIPSAADEYAQLAERGLQGLWKSSYLDELFNGGKGWQTAAESALDKLNIPSSFGNFEPGKYLNKLDEVAPFLKTGGKLLGKAVPFVDIGFGLHQAFTADNAYDRWSGGIGAAGGTLLAIAPLTGPAAPIVGAIGAGLGIVSLGMDVGKLVYENWDDITGAVGDAWDATTGAISDTAGAVSDAVGNAADTVTDTVSDVGSAISDGIGAVGDAFGF
ncbi:hypothetical protein BH708_01055 [Brachybacterium sp. P6-10-X1]|uniref:hypothetical protein n=1 Tax=Brachybacterium sp. P6-10-X1 TaxID=1903186 RepID=UPI0009719A14|nr:hypothetical protein [Brachybacterium sp. P6-10-X1]APX31546.1 hypothetical protein BH708_01055 [Brachybacterium sp. P6-10-X1]